MLGYESIVMNKNQKVYILFEFNPSERWEASLISITYLALIYLPCELSVFAFFFKAWEVTCDA
jgi:hypothetical protein